MTSKLLKIIIKSIRLFFQLWQTLSQPTKKIFVFDFLWYILLFLSHNSWIKHITFEFAFVAQTFLLSGIEPKLSISPHVKCS